MVISIFKFDPRGQFRGQNISQKVIPKFAQITKMMSNLNSCLFPLFKDTLLFQIGPLVQKIRGFEVGRPPIFSKFSKIKLLYLGHRSSNQQKILELRFGGPKPTCMPSFIKLWKGRV